MLQMNRNIVLKTIEKIAVPYEYLTDVNCVQVLNHSLLDLTQNQFCWNDIRDEILKCKHKFGNDKEVGTFVLWIDYKENSLEISIFKVEWFYFLSK